MTQEYTPVAWQDETTSQQGTLINAERLNQMQTAHHYADGLEEVDTVPTADPGVDYHKIVYCTADSTLYRWDGTEWTADIDDETKRLLEQEIARATEAERTIQGYLDAHEANHNNPHVVTKAQVGLGNCDNTADLDKPISTATQAALDGKADKATTLAGYGITDAYTKSQADALLANKADKADTYTKAQVDTALALKADQATTYSKTETDTLLGAKVSKLTTEGESAYTHNGTTQTERAVAYDVIGGSIPRRDSTGYLQAATNSTGTKSNILATGTRVQNDLDAYAPMVRTTGNQTIAGVKTLEEVKIYARDPLITTSNNGNTWHLMLKIPTDNTRFFNLLAIKPYSLNRTEMWLRTGSTAGIVLFNNYVMDQNTICIKQDTDYVYLYIKTLAAYQPIRLFTQESTSNIPASYIGDGSTYASLDNAPGTTVINATVSTPEGLALDASVVHLAGAETINGAKTFTGQMLATGQRAYSAGNTNDVATIGTLDAYTPMVRTTGTQTIRGLKTFRQGGTTAITTFEHTSVDLTTPVTNIQNINYLQFGDTNGTELATIMIQRKTDDSTAFYVHVRNANGTYKWINLGSGDQ